MTLLTTMDWPRPAPESPSQCRCGGDDTAALIRRRPPPPRDGVHMDGLYQSFLLLLSSACMLVAHEQQLQREGAGAARERYRVQAARLNRVFGLFNIPAKWYAWILLILFQFLASNVSLLGHLSGILSGFAYTYGLFNYLLPGPSFYSSIEGLSLLSICVRRPGFILCTGGTTYGQLPTHYNMSTSTAPSSLINGNLLRNISSWIPSRQTSTTEASPTQEQEDPRFPGRGRTLASTGSEPTAREASANLHARLLDNTTPSDPLTNSQLTAANTVRADATVTTDQPDTFDEELKKLVGMGFEKTQAEVALAAADGDTNVAIEILMSQQD